MSLNYKKLQEFSYYEMMHALNDSDMQVFVFL